MRGEYNCKEVFLCLPSCILILPASFLDASVYHCVSIYPVYICVFLHESADDNATYMCVCVCVYVCVCVCVEMNSGKESDSIEKNLKLFEAI